jgi:hypothetical protein
MTRLRWARNYAERQIHARQPVENVITSSFDHVIIPHDMQMSSILSAAIYERVLADRLRPRPSRDGLNSRDDPILSSDVLQPDTSRALAAIAENRAEIFSESLLQLSCISDNFRKREFTDYPSRPNCAKGRVR